MIDSIENLFSKRYKFHHLGYAAKSIDDEINFFKMLGYEVEGKRFEDPKQGIIGQFLAGNGPRIELLENMSGSNTLDPIINSRIKIYHFAYLVDDVMASIEFCRRNKGKLIREPLDSVAFNGKKIAFVVFPRGLIVELIES